MNTMTRVLPLLLALSGLNAQAHDTWFEPQPGSGPAELLIGSGNRFPLYEGGVGGDAFAKSGCRGADGKAVALDFRRHVRKATLLRAGTTGDPSALTCWAQLQPFDVELTPDVVQTYFKEIRPSAEVMAAWERLRAQGLPFRERYVKSARHDGAAVVDPKPVGTAIDVLRLAPAGAPKVGADASFQVLRDGRPMADFPVELVNEASPLGLWLRTDAQGRIAIKLPLPGRWLLRGTELKLAAGDDKRWESWFIAYSFEVLR
jgi:hypothetical protein